MKKKNLKTKLSLEKGIITTLSNLEHLKGGADPDTYSRITNCGTNCGGTTGQTDTYTRYPHPPQR